MTVTLCDICGKPITDPCSHSRYKFKEAVSVWPCEIAWRKLDCHDQCMDWLMKIVKEKMEKN